MVIKNLFKHEVNFRLTGEDPDDQEPYMFSVGRQYRSRDIENIESIGARDANDLCLRKLEPFVIHIISTMLDVMHERIDYISINVCLIDCVEYDDYDLIGFRLDSPEFNFSLFSERSEVSIYTFPENLLNDKFFISVEAYAYTVPDELREMEFRQWLEAEHMEPYTPPEETYPQEQCVISHSI